MHDASRKKILGIDPGLATVGLGLVSVENAQEILAEEWLTIETKPHIDVSERLCEIASDLSQYLTDTKPEVAVIEKLFFSTNAKTAIDVAQARGVLLQTVASHGIPITEISPRELKNAITGDGNADKQQVQDMVVRILNLDEIPQPDDAADALALAVFGAQVTSPLLTV